MRASWLGSVVWLLACGASHEGSDAPLPLDAPDAGTDAPGAIDGGSDAGLTSACEAPLPLAPGVVLAASGPALGCRPEPALGYYAITLPPFSQMEPLEGAALPEVIGDCACVAPYFESTAGYGEDLELVAVAPPHVPVGYTVATLEPNAACAAADRLGDAPSSRRLDRAGARLSICGGAARRPLYYRAERGGRARVTVDPPVPFVLGVFPTDCELRELCTPQESAGAALEVDLAAGDYLLVAAVDERRGVIVEVRLE